MDIDGDAQERFTGQNEKRRSKAGQSTLRDGAIKEEPRDEMGIHL